MLGNLRRIKQREHTFYAIRDYSIIVFLLGIEMVFIYYFVI